MVGKIELLTVPVTEVDRCSFRALPALPSRISRWNKRGA